MPEAVKRRFVQFLYSTLSLMMLLAGSISQAGAIDFYNIPSNFFAQEKCSVVKIHSLFQKEDGSVVHQEGIGSIVAFALGQGSESNATFGLITPYHVVVNAQAVFAECRGIYLPALSHPLVDVEKDIAFMEFDYKDAIKTKFDLEPLIYGFSSSLDVSQRIRKLVNPSDYLEKMANYNFTRKELSDMSTILVSMDLFGVILPPEKAIDTKVLISPQNNNLVNGISVSDQGFAKQLLKIENFGIQPGISGAPLFGALPFTYMFVAGKDFPIEKRPKALLGMVTKTRLNGAETVALSLPDIYDFLENKVINSSDNLTGRNLRVRYRNVATNKGLQLQSYLTIENSIDPMVVNEVCYGEYKNSADAKVLQSQPLLQVFKKTIEKKDPQQIILQERLSSKSEPRIQKKIDQLKNIRGGGEYGEGGDGFAIENSVFLTSNSVLGNFSPDSRTSWKRGLGEAPSLGLYLRTKNCLRPSLAVDGRIINTIRLPHQQPERMTTYEDLRRFHNSHPKNSAELIRKYGTIERKPFFVGELKGQEKLALPLFEYEMVTSRDPQWRPGGYNYFKQQAIVDNRDSSSIKKGLKSSLMLSAKELNLDLFLFSPIQENENGFFKLNYNNNWQGKYKLSENCQSELNPQNFLPVNPWLVEYADGRTQMSIELGLNGRILNVIFRKVECMPSLVFGEIEVHSNSELTAVLGTRRTVVVPKPVNLRSLIQREKK